MFVATVHRSNIPDSEKMSHLKTLLSCKAKSAISGMGYFGSFYTQAWLLLERNFGCTHLIVDAQLVTLRKQQPIKAHDSHALINYSIRISNFVSVLKQYNYDGDLQSSATLHLAINPQKLPPNLEDMWWIYVDDCHQNRPDLLLLEM